jgi:hypothetical protein
MVQRITVQTPSSTTPVKGEKKHINRGTWSPIEPRVYVLAGPEPAIVLENAIPIMGETKQKREKKKRSYVSEDALGISINGSISVLNDE